MPHATIDDDLKTHPPEVQKVLARVRQTIARALPKATEGISYQIPTFKLGASPVVYFAGWKAHYSLYPASAALVAAFSDELTPYAVSKGTIRFPLDTKVPVGLIGRLAKFLYGEASARAADQQKAPTKKRLQRPSTRQPAGEKSPAKPTPKRRLPKKTARQAAPAR